MPNVVTVAKNQEIANFEVLSIDGAESLIPIPPEVITLDEAMQGDVFNQINQLVQFADKTATT